MKFLMPLFFASLFAFANPCLSDAQVPDSRRQQRREFVGDLLKTLIEAQSESHGLHDGHGHNPNINRPGPGRPGIKGQPRPIVTPTREMIEVRKYVSSWSNQCAHLIDDLRRDENNVPRMRPLLADAIRIKASIDVLNRRCNQFAVLEPVKPDFVAIDQDWRLLHHRLKQVRGLSRECMRCIEVISQADTQLCSLFAVKPQINRRELIRVATKMDSDFQHLLQDIYYEMRSETRMPKILEDGRALHARLHHSMALIQRGSYESIVGAYQEAVGDWRRFHRKINRFPSARMQQDIANIEEGGRHIQELLWIPVELDREYVCSVIDSVGRDAGKAFDQVTLSQLMSCSAPGALLGTAREFQRQCVSFSAAVKNNRPMEELLWDFRNFEVQWDDLHTHLDEIVEPKAHRRLENVDNGLLTLKEFFGDGPEINRRTLVRICSELDQFSQTISRDIHTRIDDQRYGRGFHDQICGVADAFNMSIVDMHRRVVSNRNYDARPDLRGVVNHWTQLKPLLVKCKTKDREALFRLRGQIEPLMMKLQIIYTD